MWNIYIWPYKGCETSEYYQSFEDIPYEKVYRVKAWIGFEK